MDEDKLAPGAGKVGGVGGGGGIYLFIFSWKCMCNFVFLLPSKKIFAKGREKKKS